MENIRSISSGKIIYFLEMTVILGIKSTVFLQKVMHTSVSDLENVSISRVLHF